MSNKFEFQISDWNHYHEIDSNGDEKYVIQLFGRTEDDKDVCLKVCGFTPFFYVEVPIKWTRNDVDKFIKSLKQKVKWKTTDNPRFTGDLSESLINYGLVEKHRFRNFTNKKKFKFVMLVFKNLTAMREYSNTLSYPIDIRGLVNQPTLFQRYESNIEPHIRFMHINNISSCGWIEIDKNNLVENNDYSNCDHSYSVNWKEVKPASNDNRMAPFKIMGYDIECISGDHNFPQAERKTDKIIQIGMTMYRYGSMECYEQHILNLGLCGDVPGANVEQYKTEAGLIKGWARKISELRPDFIVGYNNFGFDDLYIFDRAKRIDKERADRRGISVDELDNRLVDELMMIIGKVNNRYLIDVEGLTRPLSCFRIQNLSSSALGDNELKFFNVPGIISIDMMKVIQRDHRLVGYSLDNVSANFITEKCEKIKEEETDEDTFPINIYTTSTKALEPDSYIQIMVKDGYSASPLVEGTKYAVRSISEVVDTQYNEKSMNEETYVYQCIQVFLNRKEINELRAVLLDRTRSVFWTFAKDDMHHTLINKFHKEGEPTNVAKVAKYCLKDCKLVILLLAKLEIVVNSLGMAKVCHVPLSYLFLRGQGVKIFSLVAKKCRERNFLIPVLRNKKIDLTGDEDESYEGATVINPRPGVYLSPISVLDYSSLYPNSMRERNLSQECYVSDPKYNNLSDHVYHDIHITVKDKKGKIVRNIDGSARKEHHRFAQEIISEEQILKELGDIYDQIEQEEKKILDKYKDLETLTVEERRVIISYYESKMKDEVAKIEDILEITEESRMEKINQIRDKYKQTTAYLSDCSDTETIEITKRDRKLLMSIAKNNATKAKALERAKRYNIVNGQTVRYGILPEILTELLNKRKDTNALLEVEKDVFKKAILNALQLAFKITANSLYGQTGAPTSPIYFLPIAASTTATGRERLYMAKHIVESNFEGAEVIYGDTDSIFINFHFKNPDGTEQTDRNALIKSIIMARRAAALINSVIPQPQRIVYEKTFHPFILVTKKKYTGLKYELDPYKWILASMGIVLKRRDNAPIVKMVYGGIIDNLLMHRDIDKAIEELRKMLTDMMAGKFSIDKFIISKTLKARYKNPNSIAHKVLADRMAERDPGNKPQINDRIPFVYVVRDFGRRKKKDILQGELIENPTYVVQNDMKIDYLYYLEHQIIKPVTQILELMMPSRHVKKLFNHFIIAETNKRKGCRDINEWLDSSRMEVQNKKATTVSKFNMSASQTSTTDTCINVGKKRKVECKNMQKWLDTPTAISAHAKPTKVSASSSTVRKKVTKNSKSSSMDKWFNPKF